MQAHPVSGMAAGGSATIGPDETGSASASEPPVAEGGAPAGAEPVTADGETGEPTRRPRIGASRSGGGKLNPRIAIIGGLVAVAVVAIAGLAYWANKVNKPQPGAVPSETPAASADSDRKYDQRVGDAANAPGGSKPATPAPTQPIDGAQRAILYEEAPDNPQEPRVLNGKVVWRLDSVNPGQGQPAETVVRADVTIPEAGLTLAIVLRRNSDATLPASHIMELTFGKVAGSDGRAIRDLGVPQFKTEENARGVPLVGLPVPVTSTVFLIGMSNLEADIERNTDLIKTRPWIDIPLRYSNGRRAVLALEKGATGEDVISQALAAWQGQK